MQENHISVMWKGLRFDLLSYGNTTSIFFERFVALENKAPLVSHSSESATLNTVLGWLEIVGLGCGCPEVLDAVQPEDNEMLRACCQIPRICEKGRPRGLFPKFCR